MILGPCPCHGCHRPVEWNGRSWREQGKRHVCAGPDTALRERPTCGAWMPRARERCGRRYGHLTEHRTEWAMACQRAAHAGRWAA